MSNMAIY